MKPKKNHKIVPHVKETVAPEISQTDIVETEKITKTDTSPKILSLVPDFMAKRSSELMFASIACAFVLSFFMIATSRLQVDGTSLMASVSNLSNVEMKTQIGADLRLADAGDHFTLISGKNMEKVSLIEGVIAIDPSLGVQVSSPDSAFTLREESPGMYRFILTMNHKNIEAGAALATITKSQNISTPVTFIDTQFVSEGQRYNLSNIVK